MDKPTTKILTPPAAGKIWRYSPAVLLVAVATVIRLMLPGTLSGTPYLVFYPAVAVSAAIGGCGPGLLCTILAMLVVDLLFDSSYLRLGFEDPVWVARQAIFVVGGAGVSLLARMLEAARAHERLQAAEIAEQRNKYRIVADNTYDWEFWLSPEGRFLYNSPSCTNVTGYDADAFIKAPDLLQRIIHSGDRASYDERLGEGDCDCACVADNVEFRIIRRDGEIRWIHHTHVPVYDDQGRYLGIRGTNRDITDRKQAELALAAAKVSAERAKADAEEANQAKDRFLALLSHELRTPLTPVLAAVSMCRKQSQPGADWRDMLEMIHRNVEFEARLIDDLLDITRIERGKIELDKRHIELRSAIERAVEVCRFDMEARRLNFDADLGDDVDYIVDADIGRLQQVFWNLLRNSIKFTPHGGRVSIRCRCDGQGSVVAEVSDNGIGIEPAALSRIFAPFAQADGDVTRRFGGLGLGLAICKSLVELHGGTIEGYSEGKGQGATFRIRLSLVSVRPRVSASASSDEASALVEDVQKLPASGIPTHVASDHVAPANVAPAGPRSFRLLVVEDHADSAEMLRLMMESQGHHVEVAGSIAAAKEMVGRNSFDMFICDLGLPDGSGLDLMRDLRANDQSLRGIALSGYGQEQDVRQSREAGFADHLTKPVDMDRLLAVVEKVANSTHPV